MSELDDLFAALHSAVAADLLERIRSGEAPQFVLKEAREFLRDNGIDLPRRSPQQGVLHSLAGELPVEDPELRQDHGGLVG